ncbi:MAG: type II toxin-antitoxin system YafQ family toxin [Treponema sp.]|jgi:mRNA interferase YafQ|nr:type II toxin-antitoxin system YafQ family toxin [Treponema sp.]
MHKIRFTSQFKKDFKLLLKRGMRESLFQEVLTMLSEDIPLPEKYHDHPLSGN